MAIALILLLGGGCSPAEAPPLRVAAAANFAPVAEAVAEAFERESGIRVTVSSGSTGKQYAQIVQGAPFDAFLAADEERPRLLEEEGRTVAGTRAVYAVGRLVLWAPGRADTGPALLGGGLPGPLAIANEDLAPYGRAAVEVLRALGVEDAWRGRLVRGENVAQTFQFVVTGNAPLGLVALSQTLQAAEPASTWLVPDSLHAPIRQEAVLLRDTPAGRAFMAFLTGPESAAVLAAAGYEPPGGRP